MYLPAAFAVDEPSVILGTLRQVAFGHLVTTDQDNGLLATALPFVVDDELTTVLAHVARANHHWRSIDGAEALLIVPGVDAYVSPRWYPSKVADPKVVPTWNYEVIHLRGTVRLVDDQEGKLDIVRTLTDDHEARTAGAGSPWAVDDAPDDFIARQLRAIIGLELTIVDVEAKRKLSQNRAEPDRRGAMSGLAASSEVRSRATAELMTGSVSEGS